MSDVFFHLHLTHPPAITASQLCLPAVVFAPQEPKPKKKAPAKKTAAKARR